MADDGEQFWSEFYRMGWSRYLPTAAIGLILPLTTSPVPLTPDELTPHLARNGGWDGPAWEEPEEFTEESLAELDEWSAKFLDEAVGKQITAEDANADERQRLERMKARLDAAAEHMGMAPIRTVDDTWQFLKMVGLVEQDDLGFTVGLAPADPIDVFALSNEEIREELRVRAEAQYAPVISQIITLFRPEAQDRRTVMKTSVQRIAQQTRANLDDARRALAILLTGPDFSANRNPVELEDHQAFEITVDWDIFDRERIGVRLTIPEDDDE